MPARAITEASFARRYAKSVFFSVLALMTLFVFYRDETFIFHPHSPDWNRYYSFRWLLVPHALTGLVALVVGPAQFSSRLRRANPALHRVLGRCYVGAVLVAAPLAFAIGIYDEPPALTFPTCTQALLWIVTTSAAFTNACHRRIPAAPAMDGPKLLCYLYLRYIPCRAGHSRLGGNERRHVRGNPVHTPAPSLAHT